MAEGAPTEQNPQVNVASKEDVAAAVEKAKTPKTQTLKLPANFLAVIKEIGVTLKDIKLVNSNLEKAISQLDKARPVPATTNKIEDLFKKLSLPIFKTETPVLPKPVEQDTGAAALKKDEPKPVIIKKFDDEALKSQQEFFKKEPLPTKIAEIDDKILNKLEKLFEKLGKGKDAGSGGFFASIVNAVKSIGPALKSLGAGLGKGFETLGKGVGEGITSIGKGFGGFLSGIGAGLGPLAAGLRTLANPQVAIGLGLVVLAINGLALALRIAEPALKAIIPLFEKIASVIGSVLLKAVETIGDIFKTAIKEIPSMIRAVGDAIASVMERAGPTLLELARIIGDVVIKAIKEIGPVITALTPAFVALIKTIKEGVIETLKLLSPIIQSVIGGVKALAGIIETILTKAIDAVTPVLMGLVPVVDKLVGLLGTALVEAIKGVSPVLENLSSAIKTAIEVIGKPIDAISSIIGKLLDLFKTSISAVEGIVNKFLENADKIADVVGRTITNTIKGVKDLIVDTLGSVVSSIRQLSDIGLIKMGEVAAGLYKVANSLKDFTTEAVKEGVRVFAALGRPGGPLDILSTLAERADNLDILSKNITTLVDTFKTINVPTDKIDQLVSAFLKFNTINVDKIKELTQLPLEKLSRAIAISTLVTTAAVATPATKETPTTAAIATPATRETPTAPATTETTPTTNTTTATVTQNVEAPAVEKLTAQKETEIAEPVALISGLAKKPAAPTTQGEFAVNTTPMLPVEPVATQAIPELNLVVDKLNELIRSLQPLLEARKASEQVTPVGGDSNLNAASLVNNNTSIYTNETDRDIPFIERNKYRQQFIYNRGLI